MDDQKLQPEPDPDNRIEEIAESARSSNAGFDMATVRNAIENRYRVNMKDGTLIPPDQKDRHRFWFSVIVVIAFFLACLLIAACGIAVMAFGEPGESMIELWGWKLTTKNAGVAICFLAAAVLLFGIRRVVKMMDR